MTKIAKGFTIIELVVVIAIIGIMAAVTIVGFTGIQQGARNTQRSGGLATIAESLEKYYGQNGEYPSCAAMAQAPNLVVTNVLPGLDPNDLTAPTAAAGTNSIQPGCATPTTSAQYGYISGTTTYTLQDYEEGGSVKTIAVARHTVASTNLSLTLKINPSNPNGTVSGAGSYAPGATPTITATPNQYYSFSSWTGSASDCYTPNTASHTVTMNAYKTCVASFTPTSISTPAAPTVNANTVGATTTWTWNATSCGGNTARYQYDYTISPSGYDSGWVATAATSVGFTTSTGGQTYAVAVQTQCYNTVTSSSWSASGSGNYVSPYYAVTLNAGAGGTVSGGGTTFSYGDTPTITATPNTYYTFSSWTGTNCSGAQSHTVPTITASMTCTANFTPTSISTPAAPTVNANTVGATTTWTWNATSCGGNTARYQYDYTISPSGYDSGWVATAATSVGFTTSTEGQTYNVAVQAQCYNAVTSSAWSASGAANYTRPITTPVITCTTASSTSINVSWTSNTYATSYTMDRATNSTFTTGLTTITQAGTTYTSTGLSQGVTYYCRVKANLPGGPSGESPYASATTTIALPTPTTPTTSDNTVGATTTWTFSTETCASGTTLQYQYDYTISPSGYDSLWVATAATSVGFTTSTEGQTYNVIIQARCYTGAANSGWTSSSASNTYYRPITTPVITATTASSTSVNVSWTSNTYATSYTMDRSLSSSFTSPTTITQAGTTYTSTGLSSGVTYYFRVKDNLPGGSSGESPYASATTTIALPTPTTPTTSDNTVGATTTWTFSTETCASGTTLQYQYDYTISPSGYDSGWTATAATSVGFTTSTEGQTYNVIIQARCYTGAANSGWTSSSASNTYYRLIHYTLTLAGANCTLSGAGSYQEVSQGVGSVATMTCTPTSTFYFDYWTGDTGCSGVSASQTITMNSNKSCTATSTHWIPGQAGNLVSPTVYVYYKDLTDLHAWKVNTTADNNTWSILGADQQQPTKRVLRNPNTSPGNTLNWQSTYPAQYNCNNTTGGRLPNEGELTSIMADKGSYNQSGLFGQVDTFYWSADEATDYDTTAAAGINSATGAYGQSGKTIEHADRCVIDTPQ